MSNRVDDAETDYGGEGNNESSHEWVLACIARAV